jgi:hypothetical protein
MYFGDDGDGDNVGKEKVFMAAAEELNVKVSCSSATTLSVCV